MKICDSPHRLQSTKVAQISRNLFENVARLSFIAMRSISREDLVRYLSTGSIMMVEVLPRDQYERAHLPGAINIPFEQVASLAPALLPDKQTPIVVYGLNFTWKTAQQVGRELLAMGYTDVREYEEGKQDWIAAGLPLEGNHLDEPITKARPSEIEPARSAASLQNQRL